MKKISVYVLLILLCLHATGCTSVYVVEKARGTPPKRDDAQPAYYALVPITALLDVALFFGWLYAEGYSYDSGWCPPSGSPGKEGLRVKRP
jgi:hypothetical protein